MKINRENYEAYFIDYLEGNLDELLVNDFIAFLQNNPDLKEELSLFEAVTVNPENISFSKKEKLYKDKFDSEKEFNQAAIASLEADISNAEKTKFHNYLAKHPEKKHDFILFGKTKLKPDESIIFSNKRKLYKQSGRKAFLLWSGRIAAILILAFAFFTIIDQPAKNLIPDEKVAKIEDKKEKKSTAVEINKTPVEKIETPIEIKKENPINIKKSESKPLIKKALPQPQKSKSLREDTKGRMTHEDLVINRIPVEVPAKMNSILASVDSNQPKAKMARMYYKTPENFANYNDERLLVDIVKEKTGLDKFQFNKITKAGLHLISNISNEKFDFKTNKNGQITEYHYDSRLFAFSIPSKKSKPE